jgi:hypothetical protein
VKGITVGDGKVGSITHEILEAFVRVRSDPKEGLPIYQEAERILNSK